MQRSQYIFAASAVFLSAALAANFLFTVYEPSPAPMPSTPAVTIPANLKDSEILTWDCEIPAYKPESITLTCADGGWLVYKIKW